MSQQYELTINVDHADLHREEDGQLVAHLIIPDLEQLKAQIAAAEEPTNG